MAIDHKIPGELLFSFALAEGSGGAFYGAWIDPLLTTSVRQEIVRRGWANPQQVAYFEEYNRYVKERGDRGRPPGAVAWGLITWGLFYTMLAGSIGFTLHFLHTFQSLTPYYFLAINAAVTFGFFLAYVLRNRRVLAEAQRHGFRLWELYPRRRREGTAGLAARKNDR